MIINDFTFLITQTAQEPEGFSEKWSAFKSAVVGIWELISLITDILGFLGLRVLVLLLITFFFLWFLNLISPLNKKTNYFLSILVGIYIALRAKMPFMGIITKYLLVVLFPFILSYCVHYIVKFFRWFFTPVNKNNNKDNTGNTSNTSVKNQDSENNQQ